jgi:hypothetical protein
MAVEGSLGLVQRSTVQRFSIRKVTPIPSAFVILDIRSYISTQNRHGAAAEILAIGQNSQAGN